MNPMPLTADFWKNDSRLQAAATKPYQAMKQNLDHGTSSLQLFQQALTWIGTCNQAPLLSGTGTFGPFDLSTDYQNDATQCAFGSQTKAAVKAFQTAFAGMVTIGSSSGSSAIVADGAAGIDTMALMDMVLNVYPCASIPGAQMAPIGAGGN
jgi:hypothetical protein